MRRAARFGLPVAGCLWILASAAGQTRPTPTAPAPRPTPTPKSFVEKVEVNVRTILVRITDAQGKAPVPPPEPGDLELEEDGRPANIIDVDPVRSQETSRPDADEPFAPNTAAASGIPQHLYVDASMLQVSSVTRLVSIFENNLNAVLSNGSLEIVVADPVPRQTLPATRQPEAVREALRRIGREVAGKQALFQYRRQQVTTLRYAFTENLGTLTRNAAEHELRMIRDALDGLVKWASTLGSGKPDVVYFATDGFDADVTETYRKIVPQVASQIPALATQPKSAQQIDQDLYMEYGPAGGEVVADASRRLAAVGVEAIPLVLGGNLREFGDDASTEGQTLTRARAGAIPLFARPVDPLRTMAEVTGGEVVTSSAQLPKVLDTFDNAFVIAYRSALPADGTVHDVEVTSRRAGLSVKGRRFTSEAPASSTGTSDAVRALRQPARPSQLTVRVSVGDATRETDRYRGMLRVDVDLQGIAAVLDSLGGGRLRLTVAVEVADAHEPFTASREFQVQRGQPGWGLDMPLAWPFNARRVAVTIEEQQTGLRGTASADLPHLE